MSGTQDLDTQSQQQEPKPKSRRVTADLPASEFQLMEDMRVVETASTTDFARALVRLYHNDSYVARLIGAEIDKMRQEKQAARKRDGRSRAWTRSRGATPHALLTEGRSVA